MHTALVLFLASVVGNYTALWLWYRWRWFMRGRRALQEGARMVELVKRCEPVEDDETLH